MFYDFDLELYKKTITKNEIGQEIEDISNDKTIRIDIQPRQDKLIIETFGKDIECDFIVFCDEDLEIADIVGFKNKKYGITNKVDWFDYKIYTINGSDSF